MYSFPILNQSKLSVPCKILTVVLMDEGMANHSTILVVRTPWTVRKSKKGQNNALEFRILHGTDNFDWFKIGKEYIQAVYCHPVYLTYMQSTPCKMPGWMKHKLELRLRGEISITSDMQMTTESVSSYGRKQRRTKELLDESERGEWKSWLKAQHSEN